MLYLVESYVPADSAGIEEIDGPARAAAEQLTLEGAPVRQ